MAYLNFGVTKIDPTTVKICEIFLFKKIDINKKIGEQYLHIPKHPAGKLFSPLSDRFAPATLSTKTIDSFRENLSNSSYKMHRLDGSFSGVSTCHISKKRRFYIYSEPNFYLHKRADTMQFLKDLVANELSQKTAELIFDVRNSVVARKPKIRGTLLFPSAGKLPLPDRYDVACVNQNF